MADRRRGWMTISKSGQEWTLPAHLGQLKTGQDGKGLLQNHQWCPDDLPRLWGRIYINMQAPSKHMDNLDRTCAFNILLLQVNSRGR